ncbi:Enamine deaminase RidA, house cleaning of reactive enamine intermediates, YjgF/YER057c/UK114 family [Alteribacillus persepolensis]|uniref:Enamine deaminase RidA, house cleaning of reactive enamine intermediates, YjgF/YER057c/UK114 family n=1 Tax=Alteribacillus persepolensis TaxID=568899 RepID=A0A1G8A3R7_9BACI|nr:RidA family protein [Alteribacillus persepolensis]SDH15497.1 Enamine deaminase RidA, house cleaning of reactive enamine intermediates, YjgF/YER057c/UK114 family [Alteribacillus persepolensis]
MNQETLLAKNNIELPLPPKQSGHYRVTKQVGNLLYVSGITCKWNGETLYQGSVGDTVSLDEGYEAAKVCGLNLLAVLQDALGDLKKVKQVVKLVGYVRCDTSFASLPKVVNGASDLLVEVFGEDGEHTRCAVGVSMLPGQASVECDLIVELHENEKKR